MKCKKCGHRSTTIGAMAAHYRKAHPKSMSRKTTSVKKHAAGSYCPTCGKKR